MNNINIQKLKLYILQKRYSEICNSIKFLQNHINNLNKYNLLDYNERNVVLSKLLEISKNINTKYNDYINNDIDTNSESESIDVSNKSEEIKYNCLDNLDEYFKNEANVDIIKLDKKPLEEYIENINLLVGRYGYGSLVETLKMFIGDIKFNLITGQGLEFVNELNQVCTTYSIKHIDTKDFEIDFGNTNIKLEVPDDFKSSDFIELERYLFIKINKVNVIRIGLIFNNDLVNINLKSSQINSPFLYNKKK